MDILFTICGRAGSKGIKNKNIRNFLGIPLPLYSLSAIRLFLDRTPQVSGQIAVNTDSNELWRILCSAGIDNMELVPRKSELSGDNASKIDVIVDTLSEMEHKNSQTYDMVVDLDITSPLRRAADIINVISVQKSMRCDVTFSVTQARRNPYFNMVKPSERGYSRVIASDFVTRQASPPVYDMNASLYAYKPEFLKTGKQLFDGYCEVVQMRDTGILDLDHEGDFELMEVIARYLYTLDRELREIRTYAARLWNQRMGGSRIE